MYLNVFVCQDLYIKSQEQAGLSRDLQSPTKRDVDQGDIFQYETVIKCENTVFDYSLVSHLVYH